MRRSLGRLIRLRGTSSSSLITCTSQTTTNATNNIRNMSSYTSFPNYRFGENADKYREEARLKRLISNSGNKNADKDPDNQFVQKGDTINLNDLLFTKERDYLIKNNNQQVKAEQLEGKVIALYFLQVPHCETNYNITKWDATFVMDEYKDLQSDNNFEVVLVPIFRKSSFKFPNEFYPSFPVAHQEHFDILFSDMPWTAVPFSDVASSERLQRIFGLSRRHINSAYMLAIIDPTGKVLQYDAWKFFFEYGALAYPFSDERIESLREEDAAIIKQPSLRKLLASPQRDYVISNKGDQVPIHTFEDKVVALYFCTCTKSLGNLELFEELKLAYKELAQVKENFEVVLIYSREFAELSDWPSEELFWQEFKTMPWLALPFRDPNCKKLNRIFEISHLKRFAGGLVIFGPHGEFIELFASDILRLYKIPGYPFTRKRVAQLETEKVKELKLEMICDPNTVVRMKDRSQVPFDQLAGKRIMLVLEFNETIGDVSLNANFLMMLKRLYRRAKGTTDNFEVIRVLIGNEESSMSNHFVRRMPWLVSKASGWIHANLGSLIWHDKPLDQLSYFPVFAFDQDGKLVRKTKYPTIKEDTCFPFSGCGLEEEALSQLNTHFEWNHWNYKGGSIYSHSDYQKRVDLFYFPLGRQY